MLERSAHDVTGLLCAWSAGDEQALEQLAPLVYSELRRLARRYTAGERPGRLDATELVHEAYIRLLDIRNISWRDRVHFYAVSARFMRRILVDLARSRRRLKREGSAQDVPLDDTFLEKHPAFSSEPEMNIVALDDVLQALTKFDARKAQVVELRFFGGLTAEETATVLKVSTETVLRDWKLAKAWMFRELNAPDTGNTDDIEVS
ncbi:MAG TPA: sigma-70 family RNA polymerase sigma factor [Bryobacteraceae bacterium]|nr:sigma-70 family RNA polymerase sigma factor [Bryobacteraceae bacterium]